MNRYTAQHYWMAWEGVHFQEIYIFGWANPLSGINIYLILKLFLQYSNYFLCYLSLAN